MKHAIESLLGITTLAFAAHAGAGVTFHEHEGFTGRTFTAEQTVSNLGRSGFNDRASSVVVVGKRWEACEDVRFQGRCMVLRPGRYPTFQSMGLNDRISSVRPLDNDERVSDNAYAPMPVVTQDFGRRRNERLYDAKVTSTRAVMGTPGQRCWVERGQVTQQQPQGNAYNLPGAAIGAIVGGILGHQVGGGTGKQIATVGGALGGAALGAQYGRNDAPATQTVSQDVRRCDNNPVQATPSYWDVTYDFRGQEHRMQMSSAPGRTVTVNRQGEPRV
ncbi:MAG TPA: beta/gamma crystallin-related protein [Ramlibacter sp.]|nr:beta/gamma crystallin-related protein [Ramlibacter sp.]